MKSGNIHNSKTRIWCNKTFELEADEFVYALVGSSWKPGSVFDHLFKFDYISMEPVNEQLEVIIFMTGCIKYISKLKKKGRSRGTRNTVICIELLIGFMNLEGDMEKNQTFRSLSAFIIEIMEFKVQLCIQRNVVGLDECFNELSEESIAATFGNGVSSACVVNIGAQAVSVLCVEDGVALPTTGVTLPFGGEDISRCLLWVEQHRQTWPPIDTDPMVKPLDLLMLNRLKETFCKFKEGDSNAPADVHYYKASLSPDVYRVALSALNVPPMGLFYPFILMPDEYPPPPRSWFHDYEDMMEDSTHNEFGKRPDGTEVFFSGSSIVLGMQDSSQSSPILKKEDNRVGLAEAITNSILATGRLDLYRKLFTSVLLVGGVASTKGLVDAVEQ
ncbi:hypothetical protein KI387_020911, partial [Taxus chinensis]